MGSFAADSFFDDAVKVRALVESFREDPAQPAMISSRNKISTECLMFGVCLQNIFYGYLEN